MTQENLTTPYYIVYETRLRRNLELIAGVEKKRRGKHYHGLQGKCPMAYIRHYQAI